MGVANDNFRRLLLTFQALSELGSEMTADTDFGQRAQSILSCVMEAADAREGALFVFRDKPAVLATATYRDLADAQAMVVVNSDLAEEHFVVDVLAKRAIRNGGKLVYVGPEANRTSQFAEVFLECKPDAQMLVVAALARECARVTDQSEEGQSLTKLVDGKTAEAFEEQTGVPVAMVQEGAAILSKSITKVVICNRDYRGPRIVGDTALLSQAAAALGCAFLPMPEKANAQGRRLPGNPLHCAWAFQRFCDHVSCWNRGSEMCHFGRCPRPGPGTDRFGAGS
jgi:NADH dehydrogenase/NADH:ubiquinone oxidoreductase subunit G